MKDRIRALLVSFIAVFGFTALFGWTAAYAEETAQKLVTIDWGTLLPVLVAAAAPMLTGLLQQFSSKFSNSAPWYAKWAVTAVLAALTGWLTSYATAGDALLSAAGGAIVGTLGTANIALRKGVGRFFNVELQPPTPGDAPPK